MEAVAGRAGVSKPTLYLRYPTKAVLVFDAIFGKTKPVAMPETGNVLNDLREAYDWAVDEFAAPEARAALPGLLAEISSNSELAQLIRTLVVDPEYKRVQELLERGQRRGDVRPDVDLSLVIDAFIGTALARVTLLDHPVDHAFGAQLVELLMRGMAPRA
jgi:AcrR family transcriptional regulator